MGTATVHTLTAEQIRAELEVLEATLGMPLEIAEQLAAADALDADQYQALRRMRDLTWLLEE